MFLSTSVSFADVTSGFVCVSRYHIAIVLYSMHAHTHARTHAHTHTHTSQLFFLSKGCTHRKTD